MSRFNAKAARAKRPCPIWVDRFQTDTQHLEADEVGAYFLLLMAMWTRESCDFPDDDNRLARVCRVSPRLWKSRIGPVIRAFLQTDGRMVFQKRLREEASFVERQVQQQSDRKVGEKPDNPLKNIDAGQSADNSTDQPRDYPSQQPNNPTLDGGGGSAGARDPQPDEASEAKTLRERMLEAMGLDPSGLTGKGGAMLGTQADMLEANRWCADLDLTPDEVLAVVAEAMQRKPDGPPSRFSYFTKAMQRYAAAKAQTATPLTPASPQPVPFHPSRPQQPDMAEVMAIVRRNREARENDRQH